MKSHFPIINYFEKKHIIYADSAATTLKLKTVIDSVSNFYSFETSNVFRGLHLLAETATEKVEMSRDIVAAFYRCKFIRNSIYQWGDRKY